MECRFAHPIEENDEESFIPSEPSTPSYYDPMELYSPVSPLYSNPFLHWRPPPPVPVGIVPYAAAPAFVQPRAQHWEPVLSYGNNLRSRENSIVSSDETVVPPTATAESISVPSIVRPMSTPPSSNTSAASNVRVRGDAPAFSAQYSPVL